VLKHRHFMKKGVKLAIVLVLLLGVAGVYYGKNVFFKSPAQKETRLYETNIDNINKPVLIELSTES